MRRHSDPQHGNASKRRIYAGGSSFPISDPRGWPPEARAWLREVKGEHSPWDIAILNHGTSAAMYLEDAVTAIGIIEADPSGWNTEGGFPIFTFDSRKIDEYSEHLGSYGYNVRIFIPAPETDHQRPCAKVVDITSARDRRHRRLAKWA